MKYQMPQERLDEMLRYLIQKPYQEVFQLVEYLKQAEPVIEEADVEKL